MDERLAEAIDGFVAGNSSLRSTVVDLLAIAAFDDWTAAAASPFRGVRACAVVAAARRSDDGLAELVGAIYEPGHNEIAEGFIESLNQQRSWRLEPTVVERLLCDRNDDLRVVGCREAGTDESLFEDLVARVIDPDEGSDVENAARDALIAFPVDVVIDRLTSRITATGPNVLVWVLDRLVDQRGLLTDGVPDSRFDTCAEVLRANAYQGWCPTLRARLDVKPAAPERRFRGFGADLAAELADGTATRAYADEDELAPLRALVTADEGSRAVLLSGPSGVGKTAIVHALASSLASDGWAVLRMTASDFLVGTKYLGEWQSRVNDVIGLLRRPEKVVLFVPEIDGLLTAGHSSAADLSVMDQLLPVLESGEIAVIGETTPEAFAAGLGAAPSVAAVFTRVEVVEADATRTLDLCRRVVDETGGAVSDDVLVRTRELAESFRGSVAEPGRTLGLLRRALAMADGAPLDVRSVLTALSESTGIPVDLLDDNAALDLAATRRFMAHRVMGQSEAVDHAVDVVTLIKAGLTDPSRPNSVMLFVGPTGVGKTELAKALAEQLFGDPKRMVRLDMSEFANWESYERLLGVHRPGVLTEPVRLQPFSVVLLDEIEKGHPNVFDLCLQLFDDGRLTDGSGRTVDFRNTIIIMTSNVGSRIRTEPAAGFGRTAPGPVTPSDIHRELNQFFRPEFLNRIDRIVTFDPLSLEVAERVTRREVAQVLERSGITRRRIAIDLDEQVIDLLLREGYSPALGARPLKRTVERHLLLPVAREIATHRVGHDGVLHIGVRDGRVVVSRVATAGPVAEQGDGAPTPPDLDDLDAGHTALLELFVPVRAERTELLEATNDAGFWNDPNRQATFDRVQRIDTLIERIDRLGDDIERTRSNRNARRRAGYVASHRAELLRLRAIIDDGGLADAFVTITLLPGSTSELDGVAALTRMYLGLADRWRFDVSVLDDHHDIGLDTVTLVVAAPGAATLLAPEAGLHRFRRTDEPAHRETVRVEVLPVPSSPPSPSELVVRRHAISLPSRFGPRRTLELDVGLRRTPGRVVVRTAGEPSSVDDAALLLAARQAHHDTEASTVVRRYDLGEQAIVKDSRTGRTTGRLADVLRGDLDRFLLG